MAQSSAHSSQNSSSYERYKLVEVIGRGSFGDVYKGFDSVANREVAIKVIDLEDIEEDIAEIQKEISMLKTCRSPNITEYYGSAVVPGTTRLMIVMELMAVSVSDLVDDEAGGQPLNEECIAYVLHEVLRALVYLHSEHRIHRDVKAANILLARDGSVKVSDFGVSAQLSGTVGFKRRTFVGSPLWMAPEVIEQAPESQPPGALRADTDGYDERADIWSLGITAIEMAKGQPPRSNVSSFRLLFMIVRDEPPVLDGTFSSQFKDFVWQCLRKDPSARPSAKDLLGHPFVANAVKPPEMERLIDDHLRMRPPLDQRRTNYGTVTSANYGTVPRWDFAGGDPRATVQRQGNLEPVGGEDSLAEVLSAGPSQFFSTVKAAPDAMAREAAAAAAAAGGEGEGGRGELEGMGMGTGLGTNTGTVRAKVNSSGTVRRVEIPSDPTIPDRPAAAGSEGGAHPNGVTLASPDTLAAPLQSLIRPALASASGTNPKAAAAASLALAALSTLESVQPGASRSMVGDLLAMLSATSSPSLQALRTSAEAVFGGNGVQDGSNRGTVADMGPLGNYLLNRWRESAARERMHQAHYPS